MQCTQRHFPLHAVLNLLPSPSLPLPPPGSVNVDNLGGDYPMLAGNLASILSSLFICGAISLWKPQNYDWQTTREIPTVEEGTEAHYPSSGAYGIRLPGCTPVRQAASWRDGSATATQP